MLFRPSTKCFRSRPSSQHLLLTDCTAADDDDDGDDRDRRYCSEIEKKVGE